MPTEPPCRRLEEQRDATRSLNPRDGSTRTLPLHAQSITQCLRDRGLTAVAIVETGDREDFVTEWGEVQAEVLAGVAVARERPAGCSSPDS
jgi:hypothetical protein